MSPWKIRDVFLSLKCNLTSWSIPKSVGIAIFALGLLCVDLVVRPYQIYAAEDATAKR